MPRASSLAAISLLPVELLDKAALIELGDEARVDELFRFVIVNFRPALRHLLVSELETADNRVRRRDKILAVDVVGAFEEFAIGSAQIFRQDLQARLLLGL